MSKKWWGYFTGIQGNVDKWCEIITVRETTWLLISMWNIKWSETWFLACDIHGKVKLHDF